MWLLALIIYQRSVSSALTLLLTGFQTFPQHLSAFQTAEESRCCEVSSGSEKQLCPVAHTQGSSRTGTSFIHSAEELFNAQRQMIHHCRLSPWKLYSDKCKLPICNFKPTTENPAVSPSSREPLDSGPAGRAENQVCIPAGLLSCSAPGMPRSQLHCCAAAAAETLLNLCQKSPSGVDGVERWRRFTQNAK